MNDQAPSYQSWESDFGKKSIHEMIALASEQLSLLPLAQLAALRNRFLDIAFHDKETDSNMRGIAACWVRVLESLVILSNINDDIALNAFIADRDLGRKHARELGYGTPVYLASLGKQGFIEKLFSGSPVATSDESGRREFLDSVAFGRRDDAKS